MFEHIPFGNPETPNVVIEIPAGSSLKLEYDEVMRVMKLDFVFRNDFHFPFNYGFIPGTKAEDGDTVDAVVLSSHPIPPQTVVAVKLLGLLKLKDRGERDNKVITVPRVDPLAETLSSMEDLGEKEKADIVEFFKEVGVQKRKSMDIEGFGNRLSAVEEIRRNSLP